ncbi:MAG: hypothetical protein IJX67_08895 [Oscillospiraceae bacterium]|nr:hypothetical protein [Oscillospiraceae bacterium]
MAKPGQRKERSAQSYRRELGVSIHTILVVIDLISKHGAKNGMAQMIVRCVPSKVGIEMLDGVVDMLLDRDLLVVAFL